jgi:hypothetical protein
VADLPLLLAVVALWAASIAAVYALERTPSNTAFWTAAGLTALYFGVAVAALLARHPG